jgi:hypothetical protein
MIILLLYSAICYLFMIGFLGDLKCPTKTDKIYKTLCIIFAPIVFPYMMGILLNPDK